MSKYIWQNHGWPELGWRAEDVVPLLAEASFRQGAFLGELATIGFDLRAQAGFDEYRRLAAVGKM